MATVAQLEDSLIQADAAGDTQAASALADAIRQARGVQGVASASNKRNPLYGDGYDKVMNFDGKNSIAGSAAGFGAIGSTLLTPIDALARKFNNGKPINIGGYDIAGQDRRKAIDGGLEQMGADPTSMQFQAAKLGTEVGVTAPFGGLVAGVLSKAPAIARNIPTLIDTIRTGGMSANGVKGVYGAANRVAGGSVNGLITAGAIDPDNAEAGAMIGGGFPIAVKLAGTGGKLIGTALGQGKQTLSPTKLQTARESIDAGYKIPPSMVNPSFKNRVVESMSGKHATAQIASTKNQAVTERLVRGELGLADDVPLTFDSMRLYRGAQHSAGYEPLRQVGMINAGQQFNQSLDDIVKQYTGKGTIPAIEKKEVADLVAAHKSNGFDSGDAIDAIRILRENASEAFAKSNGALGKANKAIANAYETAIDDALQASGKTDMLAAYRAARKKIAQSATVEKAIREGAGTLDARILARELQKGKPLSGGIKTAAQFANTFDKAAQPPHLIGSPGVHNLTAMFSTGSGAAGAAGGAAVGGPMGAAIGGGVGAAYPFVIPPLMRARMFSNGAQKNLVNGNSQGLLGNSIDELLPLMYRTNPALMSGLIDQ